MRLEDRGGGRLHAHEELLRRAVENVVRNAVRHTANGTTVVVSVSRDEAEFTIRVHDQGPGVPESSLPQMFEPFFRDPEARADHPMGHGVGLAIAKRAVEVHGGSITAGNHARGGLVVDLRLPFTG